MDDYRADVFNGGKIRHAKVINENTPKSKIFVKSNNRLSQKDLSSICHEFSPGLRPAQEPDFTKCTPRTPVSEQANNNDFSITNPFESHNTIDSLLQPSFSPSVFVTNGPLTTESQETPNSFWNIDQIAVLKPIDIDLSSLHKQEDVIRLDPATEKEAQDAIDKFFASHIDIPSPWSGDRSSKHYLALISPSPANLKKKVNMRTPGTGKAGCSSSSGASSLSSQIRVRKFNFSNANRFLGSSLAATSVPGDSCKSQNRGETSKINCINASTQTKLTLSASVDLEHILSQYYTYEEGHTEERIEAPCEALSNSSLRRKLFFPDCEEIKTEEKDEIDPNPLIHVDDEHEIDNLSPFMLHKLQQAASHYVGTPAGYAKLTDIPQTPSSCQSHFSSSPLCDGINLDLKTPCSGCFQRPRFGSVRKMLLGSSEDDELVKGQLNDLDSPGLSPVRVDFVTTGSMSIVQDIGQANSVDVSMTFHDPNSVEVGKENDIKPVGPNNHSLVQMSTNFPVALESSRRQLLLDSLPISPIAPIKHERLNDKKSSSMNRIRTPDKVKKIFHQHDHFKLCPSPMPSPIPCGQSKSTEKHDRKPLATSLLSSTQSYGTQDKMDNFRSPPTGIDSNSELMNVKNFSGRNENNSDADVVQKCSVGHHSALAKKLDGNETELGSLLEKTECSSNTGSRSQSDLQIADELCMKEIKENIFPPPAICSSVIMQDDDLSSRSVSNYTSEDPNPSEVLDKACTHQDMPEQFFMYGNEKTKSTAAEKSCCRRHKAHSKDKFAESFLIAEGNDTELVRTGKYSEYDLPIPKTVEYAMRSVQVNGMDINQCSEAETKMETSPQKTFHPLTHSHNAATSGKNTLPAGFPLKQYSIQCTVSEGGSHYLVDVPYQQAPSSMAYSDCDTTRNSHNPVQGDSGYSTTQSNFQTSRVGAQVD